ncbi:uncharacterized protein ARMOST_14823 [Armillaria ostoyae]|uniref:Uncharacterized protein n=1 Tax=Armillaria ostoyae TaxID=47428 RepID=A0A284RRN5_ARMOS|nr:uncharacterized protein ARMOST_14823 [Armillaria ostoyae]
MNKILREMQEKAEEEEARKPLKRPPTNRCTGCNHKFQNGDDEDWEEDRDECPDCGLLLLPKFQLWGTILCDVPEMVPYEFRPKRKGLSR